VGGYVATAPDRDDEADEHRDRDASPIGHEHLDERASQREADEQPVAPHPRGRLGCPRFVPDRP
jgi:hypothetical protein